MYQTLHQGFFRLERNHLHLFIRKRFWKIINNCLPSLKSTCHQVCFVGLKKTHLRHLFQVLKQQKSFGYPRIWKLQALKRTRKVEAEYHRKHNWMHPALPSWTTRLMGLVPAPFSTPWTWHSMGTWRILRLEYFPMWSYKRNNKSWDDIAISHGEKPLRKFLKNPHLNASWGKPCWDNKQCEPGGTLQTPSVDPATHECQPQSKCHKNRHRQTHPKYLQDTSKIRPSNTCAKCIKMLKFWRFPCPAQLLSLVRVVCAQSHCLDKKVFNLLLQVAVCRVCSTSTKASPFRCGALPGKGTVMASVCWQLSCLALGAAASQASASTWSTWHLAMLPRHLTKFPIGTRAEGEECRHWPHRPAMARLTWLKVFP